MTEIFCSFSRDNWNPKKVLVMDDRFHVMYEAGSCTFDIDPFVECHLLHAHEWAHWLAKQADVCEMIFENRCVFGYDPEWGPSTGYTRCFEKEPWHPRESSL